MTLSKAWLAVTGIECDEPGKPKGGSPLPFALSAEAMLLVAGVMRHIFGMGGIASPGAALGAGQRALLRLAVDHDQQRLQDAPLPPDADQRRLRHLRLCADGAGADAVPGLRCRAEFAGLKEPGFVLCRRKKNGPVRPLPPTSPDRPSRSQTQAE